MTSRRATWGAVGLAAVLVWTGTLLLAVRLASGPSGAAPEELQVLPAGDYEARVESCRAPEGEPAQGEPSQGEPSAVPRASRTATGTLTNTAEEARSFRVHVQFVTDDGVRVDRAPALVEGLGPGETARFTAASYLADAGASGLRCTIGTVVAAGGLAGADGLRSSSVPSGLPAVPPVDYRTSDNTDEGEAGDVGDIDAVTYLCYVVDPRVPVACGTVSN